MKRYAPVLVVIAMALFGSACTQAPASGDASSSVSVESKDAVSVTPEGCQQAKTVTEWLIQRAVPLSSLSAGAGFADLAKLKPVLEGVRVVGLGEATHGSREFFTMKHRMVEFLVKEMGFTVFGIEAGYPEALSLNEYIHGGAGSVRSLIMSMGYWPWATQELQDQVEWMRAYNQSVPTAKRISFVGIDVQGPSGANYLTAYLKKVAPETYAETFTILNTMATRRLSAPSAELEALDQTKLESNLIDGLLSNLADHRAAYVSASSEAVYQVAVNMAHNLARFHAAMVAAQDLNQAATRRDQYMAETALDLLDQAGLGARMVIWAHNLHVADAGVFMGGHLRKALGSQYYAVGFAFDHGGLNAWDIQSRQLVQYQALPPKNGQLDWYFACTGLGNAFVDYRSGERIEEISSWLHTEIPARSIGTVYDPEKPETTEGKIPPGAWDAMIYVPITTAATGL